MKKSLIAILTLTLVSIASVVPAFATCPCQQHVIVAPCPACDPCGCIEKTAGIVNYAKDLNRTNFGVIKKERQFSDFEGLIKKAGLKAKVDKGNYTILAPTNTAIRNMDQSYLAALKQPENKDALVKFVMAHMISGDQSAACMCANGTITNLNCCTLAISKECNTLKVGCSNIIAPDILTRTGRVQAIDRVLIES